MSEQKTPGASGATQSADVYSRKIGVNRSKSRLWLEGRCLSDHGWNRGDRFDLVFEEGKGILSITRNPEGRRKVAGTDSRPIIDTNTDRITEVLRVEKGDLVTVMVTSGLIVVTGA